MGRLLRSEALRRKALWAEALRAAALRGEALWRGVCRGRRVATLWVRALARTASTAALATLGAGAALAAEPTGIWFDHTGRGAVEITNCGSALCGRVVWLRDAGNRSACGLQIIGNVRPAKGGAWDGGWIYDPDKDAKYSVEITPIGTGSLKVVGYLGSKLLSETMLWRRAPADLKRCHA